MRRLLILWRSLGSLLLLDGSLWQNSECEATQSYGGDDRYLTHKRVANRSRSFSGLTIPAKVPFRYNVVQGHCRSDQKRLEVVSSTRFVRCQHDNESNDEFSVVTISERLANRHDSGTAAVKVRTGPLFFHPMILLLLSKP